MTRLPFMRSFIVALMVGCVLAGGLLFFLLRSGTPTDRGGGGGQGGGATPVTVLPPGPAPVAPSSLPPRPPGIVSFTIAYTADTGAFLENCG